jgi:hypothetical protein
MKRIFFLMLVLLIGVSASMNAQVTIGSDQDPRDGAVLDLSQVYEKNLGFLLPQVSLTNIDGWQLKGSSTNGIGMLVYNINEDVEGGNGSGLYVWSGAAWNPVKAASGFSASVLVTDFTVDPYNSAGVEIWEGASQPFTVSEYYPPTATYQAVTWDIASGNGIIELLNPTVTGCTIRGLQPGNAQLRVTSMDQTISKTINIIVKEVTVTNFSLSSPLSLLTGSASGTITAGSFIGTDGNPVTGVSVNWSVVDGTVPEDAVVNATGNTYTVTSGATAGSFTVRASVGSVFKECTVTINSCPGAIVFNGAYNGPAQGTYTTGLTGSFSAGWTNGVFTAQNKDLCWASSDAGQVNWTAASTICPDDWRLPNLKELQVLYEALGGNGGNAAAFTALDSRGTGSNVNATAMQSYYYWSSNHGSSDGAYSFNNYNGSRSSDTKTSPNYVRCVRSL